MDTFVHAHARPRRVLTAFAVFALLVGLVLVAIGTGDASAQKSTPDKTDPDKTPPKKAPLPKLLVLGASAQTAPPACPSSPCQAIGKVTGFQTTIGNAKKPFLAPFDGKIVAWSIKLSAPTDQQTKFFNDFYGGQPSARVSILKPLVKEKLRYKLRAQSPIEDLSSVLGGTVTFALKVPLAVRTGQIVALSVPTWAPAFGIGLAKDNAWRASRKPNKCSATDDIQAGSAQQALAQERIYGCSYSTARLLYSATLVRGAP
jgi:hypothetical protein